MGYFIGFFFLLIVFGSGYFLGSRIEKQKTMQFKDQAKEKMTELVLLAYKEGLIAGGELMLDNVIDMAIDDGWFRDE